MDPAYPLVPVANVLAAVLVLLSLITAGLRQAWNAGVVVLALWTFLGAIRASVDAVIWRDNFNNVTPVWCDISSHMSIALSIAIPACSFVITRRLHKIISLRGVDLRSQRAGDIMPYDLSICIGLPLVITGVYYVVQSARFQIFEEVGCQSALSATGLTILISSWTFILPVASIVFFWSRLVIVLYRHYKELNQFTSSEITLTRSRYLRVFAIGSLDILFSLPIGISTISQASVQGRSAPFWPGFDVVHRDFTPVLLPAEIWKEKTVTRLSVRASQYVNVVSGVLIFVLFGLSGESRELYRRAFWRMARVVGWAPRDNDAALEPRMTFLSIEIDIETR
ncbi:GPCR fungal pheromone mating factor [Amylostereum chailletii]|nr:GPCR fungal pheromone mating factor [Amylostereum chailletii]